MFITNFGYKVLITLISVNFLFSGFAQAKSIRIDRLINDVENGKIDCIKLGYDKLIIGRELYLPRKESSWLIKCPTIEFANWRVRYEKPELVRKLRDKIIEETSYSGGKDPHIITRMKLSIRASRIIGDGVILAVSLGGGEDGAAGSRFGGSARNGRGGGNGGNGRDARCRITWKGIEKHRSGDGGHGAPGGNGEVGTVGRGGAHGQHGSKGPRIDIVVREFLGGADLTVMSYGQNGGNGGAGGSGQRGGRGGTGGHGGKGGNAASCHSASSGGNGGRGGAGGRGGSGGRGGNGGNGGDGGDITVQGTVAAVDRVKIINEGGAAGRGGRGGRPGAGGAAGRGGPAGCGGSGRSGPFVRHGPGGCGTNGAAGPNGAPGQPGRAGRDGRPGVPGQRSVPRKETFTPSILRDRFGV